MLLPVMLGEYLGSWKGDFFVYRVFLDEVETKW